VLRQVAVAIVAVFSAAGIAAAEQTAMLDATADVGISSVRGRWLESNGAGPSTPIRQTQNWSGFETKALLITFDTRPIQGWRIDKAYLHLYTAKGDLYGVGVCEVLAPWREGRGMNGQEATGAACWQYARTPRDRDKPEAGDWWAWPGSGIASVSWAHPMARYSHAAPGEIHKERVGYPGEGGDLEPFIHLRIPVKPELVASLAAGTCYGFALTDDKGQVAESYSLIGPGYPYLTNDAEDPYVFTREIQDESLRPKLEVIGEPGEKVTLAAPSDLKAIKVQPSTSTVTMEFTVPAGDALAYEVLYSEVPANPPGTVAPGTPLPRWEIPLPAKVGIRQQMPIWTLPPGDYEIGVRAVDVAGNRGEAAHVAVTVPQVPEARLAAVPAPHAVESGGADAAGAGVYVVPDIVKVDPVSGAVLRAGDAYRIDEGYSRRNPVWNAADNRISLNAAVNETVAFQVIVGKGENPLQDVHVAVSDLVGAAGKISAVPNAQAFRSWYMRSSSRRRRQLGPNEVEDVTIRPVAWHADACVPVSEPFVQKVNVPAEDNGIEGQTNQAFWVDIYVPKGTAAGDYAGKVTVTAEGLARPVELGLALKVLPLALPDQSSWIVELNSYGGLAGLAGVGGRDPAKAREAEWEFYRLAKQHREMNNALPYKQSGRVDGPAPRLEIDGTTVKIVDWSAFDEYYGPLLDGSLFTAGKGYVGPGAGTPISEMYLAFHENWPLPVEKWYQDYAKMKTRLDFAQWAKKSRLLDEAFSDEYKHAYADVARQFAEHLQQKGWTGTRYQVFGNNKYYFKIPYFASQLTAAGNGSSFWLLDEPVDFDDYMANAFFLGLVQRGVKAAKAPDVKFAFRTDVSQPEMTRGLWNDVCDLWVCGGGAIRTGYVTTAVVRQKWLPGEEFWHYGGGPSLSAAPVNMLHSFLASWASGSTGMLPWWTTEGGNSWTRPKDVDLALFYTGRNYANSGKDYPGPLPGLRMKVARRAQQDIEYLHLLAAQKGWDRHLVRKAIAAYADDPAAPVLEFTKMTPEQQFELRESIAATILAQRERR
jgi:hypothetical protein